jgi:drug/metabolite transporter (DMT)-like permease
MELWFIFALVAVVFGGLHVFAQKIGAARGYNSSLLNSYSAGLSSAIGFIIAGFFEGFSELSSLMVMWAVFGGAVYIFGSNYRMDGLKYIDTTVFLPLHKFVSPLFALALGIVFFKEALTVYEWAGVILGMTVPLLLISRTENSRQKNMARGLLLLVLSAALVAASAAINKEGTNLFSSVLLFAAVTNTFGAIMGIIIYRLRKKGTNTEKETHHFDKGLLTLAVVTSIIQVISFSSFLLAFSYGGSLAIVYTIHSLYIIIPIILSIIFFKEHWDTKKVVAIVVSIAAIGLMR